MIQMKLTAKEKIESGKATLLSFLPVNTINPELPVALEEVHAQKLHLIIVSEDLSFFSHQHPQWNGNAYSLEFSFPAGGTYLLYADYKPAGLDGMVDQLRVAVKGEAAASAHFTKSRLSFAVSDLSVALDVNNLAAIKAIITKDETVLPASQIDDFLGAKAHVVMIHTKTKEYLHVHPVVHHNNLVLHAGFSATGTYRAWVQFLIGGKLYTADFVLDVAALPQTSMHMHHH